MKTGRIFALKNKEDHEMCYGDLFDFDFNSLKGTGFEGSNFGQSIYENPPDQITLKIGKNKFGYFNGTFDYLKEGIVIDTFSFEEHSFLRYVTGKQNLTFIKNEPVLNYEKSDINININDVFLMPFSEFSKTNYLKVDALNELQANNPENIIVHIVNMKDVGREYSEGLGAKVYAIDKKGFVTFDTPEEKEEELKYCKEKKSKYIETLVDYDLNGLDFHNISFMKKLGLFENKIAEIKGVDVSFEEIQKLLKKEQSKKMNRKL